MGHERAVGPQKALAGTWVTACKVGEHFPDGAAGDVEGVLPARHVPHGAGHPDLCHRVHPAGSALRPALASARQMRSGDMGNSRNRTPVARAMALATAAMGGTMGTSPTPRTP